MREREGEREQVRESEIDGGIHLTVEYVLRADRVCVCAILREWCVTAVLVRKSKKESEKE